MMREPPTSTPVSSGMRSDAVDKDELEEFREVEGALQLAIKQQQAAVSIRQRFVMKLKQKYGFDERYVKIDLVSGRIEESKDV